MRGIRDTLKVLGMLYSCQTTNSGYRIHIPVWMFQDGGLVFVRTLRMLQEEKKRRILPDHDFWYDRTALASRERLVTKASRADGQIRGVSRHGFGSLLRRLLHLKFAIQKTPTSLPHLDAEYAGAIQHSLERVWRREYAYFLSPSWWKT
jgi:hypothetical protein